MKAHSRQCQPLDDTTGNPCLYDHEYLCHGCKSSFTVSEDTFYTTPAEHVYPSAYWPFCDQRCLNSYLQSHPGFVHRTGTFPAEPPVPLPPLVPTTKPRARAGAHLTKFKVGETNA